MADNTPPPAAAAPAAKENGKPAAKPAAVAKPARFIAASESRFASSADFSFPLTSYIPEADTPLEHVLRADYWANIKRLRAGARIWVQPEDDRWWAELLVRKVGQGFAKVQLLRQGELDALGADPADAGGYLIEFKGPIVKHRVVRVSDSTVLKQGLETQDDAAAWLRDHKRMLAA